MKKYKVIIKQQAEFEIEAEDINDADGIIDSMLFDGEIEFDIYQDIIPME